PLFRVTSVRVTTHSNREYHTLTLTIVPSRDVTALDVDGWARNQLLPALGRNSRLVSARGSRPGYFFRTSPFQGGRENDVDFEVFCPDPDCPLNRGDPWSETTPEGRARVPAAFQLESGESSHIPIPALTVDDQVYHRCPTMVVATVDK